VIATTLDHLGWLARDAGALHGRFERLGFQLTPWATHRGPGTPPPRLATGNRCAMLRDGGYLELIGIVDHGLPRGWIGPYLDRGDGIPVLALGMDDAEANLARLRRAGPLAPSGIEPLARPVSDADEGPHARFALLPLPDSPEGRVQLVQHLTPELLWQERFLDHPNRAVALEAAIVVSDDPAPSAERLSRLAGRPVVPDPLGGFALPLGRGAVRVLPPEALPAALPGAVAPPDLPCVVGAVVRVGDDGTAIRTLLGSEAREAQGGVLAEAGGGWVLFTWQGSAG
jgi:hypothetical protein